MSSRSAGYLPVEPGLELSIRAIRWHEPAWEFDCPTAILSPVFRTFEDGRSIEAAVEDLLIDACIDGCIRTEDEDSWAWRGWTKSYLKRKQYRKGVERKDIRVRFVLDKYGDLSWEPTDA